jgi:hypothetical protein
MNQANIRAEVTFDLGNRRLLCPRPLESYNFKGYKGVE